ncbi:hypothetical protein BLNAU_16293 [Blattamonas nauphoetae]|uniref:Right handed beta helix domain-containing protein n=1 Tax=Blattamonas nauphoetae TaxID=2049346 RepID=A0ABQ9X8E3_9EUKA|nr:hypothetical protein BLNAU_16293 [Blattamonas nauphoetae]
MADKLAFVGIDDSGREHSRVRFVLEFLLLLPPPLPQLRLDSSVIFSNCPFTGEAFGKFDCPLLFYNYPGTISILSCSFTNINATFYHYYGGAINVVLEEELNRTYFTARSSNFTNCISRFRGGAIYLEILDDVLIDSCRFDDCSISEVYSFGGGLFIDSANKDVSGKQAKVVDCVLADCFAVARGGGLYNTADLALSVVDTRFERCESMATEGTYSFGGGIHMDVNLPLTVERTHFIGCQSAHGGGAFSMFYDAEVSVSDILVQNCYSGTTGAICIRRYSDAEPFSLSHVYFVGNSMGEDKKFFPAYTGLAESTHKFRDFALLWPSFEDVVPAFTLDDCFTNIIPDSNGMVIGIIYDTTIYKYEPELYFHEEFEKIGPLLTAKPTGIVNQKTGKIELEMKGKTPPISQEYEVTLKEDETGTETKLRMLFSDGTGNVVSGSDSNLPYDTNCTITSIVGVIPDSSSSQMTNGFTIPAVAWPFNLAVTPNYLSFTTPEKPSTLLSATSDLISNDPKFAYVIIHFNKEVSGSFDIVVLEDGKDVTITVSNLVESLGGESSKFIVVGEDHVAVAGNEETAELADSAGCVPAGWTGAGNHHHRSAASKTEEEIWVVLRAVRVLTRGILFSILLSLVSLRLVLLAAFPQLHQSGMLKPKKDSENLQSCGVSSGLPDLLPLCRRHLCRQHPTPPHSLPLFFRLSKSDLPLLFHLHRRRHPPQLALHPLVPLSLVFSSLSHLVPISSNSDLFLSASPTPSNDPAK